MSRQWPSHFIRLDHASMLNFTSLGPVDNQPPTLLSDILGTPFFQFQSTTISTDHHCPSTYSDLNSTPLDIPPVSQSMYDSVCAKSRRPGKSVCLDDALKKVIYVKPMTLQEFRRRGKLKLKRKRKRVKSKRRERLTLLLPTRSRRDTNSFEIVTTQPTTPTGTAEKKQESSIREPPQHFYQFLDRQKKKMKTAPSTKNTYMATISHPPHCYPSPPLHNPRTNITINRLGPIGVIKDFTLKFKTAKLLPKHHQQKKDVVLFPMQHPCVHRPKPIYEIDLINDLI